MKTPSELVPFVNHQVSIQLEDGRIGYGVLRVWQMHGPREYPYVLEPSDAERAEWAKRRFFAREVADIQLLEATIAAR
jgi:hypothetical protein